MTQSDFIQTLLQKIEQLQRRISVLEKLSGLPPQELREKATGVEDDFVINSLIEHIPEVFSK